MDFPNWSSDPKYLPNLEELKEINNFGECGRSDFIHHNPHGTPFQLLNREFIEGIGNKILEKINNISGDTIKILEVGAGNGRLTYFLNKYLTIESIKKNINQIASDDLSREEIDNPEMRTKILPGIVVEKCNVEESIKNHQPEIIISSWMPYNQDWTTFFRKNQNTEIFIMIGNTSECGKPESWIECDKFGIEKIDILGNISWQDQGYTWGLKNKPITSEIYLFITK